ncbi:MAG: acetylglutamate kinase [Eggerthellaceae bacterium]|nr:acetylglutamate kinase [Eggerthellaceae bacterium]
MKLSKDTRPNGVTDKETAQLIAEALPWIKNITGKTIVIKYGGAAMVDPQLRAEVMSDIVLLKIVGVNPIIVHGGGKDITRAMEQAGLPVEFKDGQRVTTDEGMDIVRTILAGKVNQELVRALNEHGDFAVGVNGVDGGTIIAEPELNGLGRVGRIKKINSSLLNDLINADYIPVIASVAIGNDGGYCNVNADVVAGKIAAAAGASKILFLTDVDGLYLDFEDKDSLVSQLSVQEARDLIDSGKLSSGMIPKLKSCVVAIDGGVSSAYIINGTISHSILLEMLTMSGVGTAVYTGSGDDANPHVNSGSFASKLLENK